MEKTTRYGSGVKYGSNRDDYMTPPEIYEPILKLFNKNKFDIDVCCTQNNIPAWNHYTKEDNGLLKSWSGLCFCNPPWNKAQDWIKKGAKEMNCYSAPTVCYVLPANRFETGYMQKFILNNEEVAWLVLPNKQGFIIPGQEHVPPIPSVGVLIAVMSKHAEDIREDMNDRNIFKTTAYRGMIQPNT